MNKINLVSTFLILTLAVAERGFCQRSPKAEVKALLRTIEKTHRDIDWTAFDTTSKVRIDSINYGTIQGAWKAYNGIFKFNGSCNSMVLITPLEIEFKDDGFRPGKQPAFTKFMLTNNRIDSKEDDYHACINKITDHLLVLTLINGENFTRYYYEK
ncbi:hypothetical protein ACX0G9_30980 [Flavitalea flava]